MTTTTTVHTNGVDLCVEEFGSDAGPLVLLVGAPTMLSWPAELCELLAAGGRRVVRYDLRDSGGSTTLNPESPGYTLRDLAADAAGLVAAMTGGEASQQAEANHVVGTAHPAGTEHPVETAHPAGTEHRARTEHRAGTAHIAGIGVSGMVAQVAAIEHPATFSALTLVGTRSVAPGPVDDDLPDHNMAVMRQMFSEPDPNWSDRAAVAEVAAQRAVLLGNDPERARTTAAAIWDRTPGTDPAEHRANQSGEVFARIDCTPRWRERLPEIEVPTLVVHGRRDQFFPVGNGEAIAAEVPGARLLVVEDTGTEVPLAAVDDVAAAMLEL